MVLTRYKEDAPKPKEQREPPTVSEWLQEMADAGFDGEFKAEMGELEYKGYLAQDEAGKGIVKSKRIPKQHEVMERLKALKNS